jgi:hypothetical protein
MVGILLALQVNNWNEHQKTLQSQSNSLIRLHSESEMILKAFKRDIKASERWIEKAKYAASILGAISHQNIDSSKFIDGIESIGYYPDMATPRSVYDELNASGKFMQIISDSVKMKVIDYYSYLDFINSQLAYFRQTVKEPEQYAKQDFYSVYDSTSWGVRKQLFNIENLVNNKPLITSHLQGLRNIIVFNNFRKQGLLFAESMCSTLAKESGESCTVKNK